MSHTDRESLRFTYKFTLGDIFRLCEEDYRRKEILYLGILLGMLLSESHKSESEETEVSKGESNG